MRLFLVRHGETAHNADGITLGRADVPLNQRGIEQAQSLGRLASGSRVLLDAPPIAAIYASPLQRAMVTAAPLAGALGIEVQPEPRLIEMDVGDTEGLAHAQVRERYPEFLGHWLSDDVADARMPGGETLGEVQERAWAAIAEMAEGHAGESAVAVTHNFVILALLCRVLNLPLGAFRSVRQDLAAVSVIDVAPDASRVITLNDRCHLDVSGLDRG